MLYLISRRSRRLAMGLSRSEMTMLGPIGGHPIGYTRRYEPATWRARWAWVDLALSVGALALLAVHARG